MKKILTILIACLLACTMLVAFTACNSPEEEPKVYSKGLKFELNEEGTGYILVGIGSCGDKKLVIPETYNKKPVVEVGDSAFLDNWNITAIDIPDNVTTLQDSSFKGCRILTEVKLGKGVKSIGYRAFSSCTSLESIVIPLNVVEMEELVFASCTKLRDIYYPGAETPIGWHYTWKYDTSAVIHYNYTGK